MRHSPVWGHASGAMRWRGAGPGPRVRRSASLAARGPAADGSLSLLAPAPPAPAAARQLRGAPDFLGVLVVALYTVLRCKINTNMINRCGGHAVPPRARGRNRHRPQGVGGRDFAGPGGVAVWGRTLDRLGPKAGTAALSRAFAARGASSQAATGGAAAAAAWPTPTARAPLARTCDSRCASRQVRRSRCGGGGDGSGQGKEGGEATSWRAGRGCEEGRVVRGEEGL